MAARPQEGAGTSARMTITTDEAPPALSTPAPVDAPLTRRRRKRLSHRLQPDDPRRDNVLNDYERGLSIVDIRMRHNLGAQTLKTWITEAGLSPRTRGRNPQLLSPGEETGLDEDAIGPELRDEIREGYRSGVSKRELRTRYDLTLGELNTVLRGIPKSITGQALDLSADGVTHLVDPLTGRRIVWEVKFVQCMEISAVTIEAVLADIRARMGTDIEVIGIRRI